MGYGDNYHESAAAYGLQIPLRACRLAILSGDVHEHATLGTEPGTAAATKISICEPQPGPQADVVSDSNGGWGGVRNPTAGHVGHGSLWPGDA